GYSIIRERVDDAHRYRLDHGARGLDGGTAGSAPKARQPLDWDSDRQPMTTRGNRAVRPATGDAVPRPAETAAPPRRGTVARIVALIRTERSLALAAFSVVPLKFIADTAHIGEVGHFGFLTSFLLVYIFLVVVFAALGVVRHAERLAEKYGEPYGTLILTVS